MTALVVQIENVEERWRGQLGVENILLSIPEGSFVPPPGRSGCGKSTTLRLVAGFEMPDSGATHIGETFFPDRDHRRPCPER